MRVAHTSEEPFIHRHDIETQRFDTRSIEINDPCIVTSAGIDEDIQADEIGVRKYWRECL